MSDARTRLRLRRRRASRGQAIIELMLFFSLLVFMVLGATDISTLLDDHLNVIYAARTGARVGAVMGRNTFADCAIIGAVQSAIASNHNVTLNTITIYEANNSGGKVGPEEVYPGDTMCTSADPNSGTLTKSATTDTWQAGTRVVTPFTEQSIGVQLDYTYTFAFEPLGGKGAFNATDYAVMPLEVVINQSATPTPSPAP